MKKEKEKNRIEGEACGLRGCLGRREGKDLSLDLKMDFNVFFSVCVCLQDLLEVNSTMVKSQTNTARVEGLRPGTVYVVQVRARTVAGFGKYSSKMCFQTLTNGKDCLRVCVCVCVCVCDREIDCIKHTQSWGSRMPKNAINEI